MIEQFFRVLKTQRFKLEDSQILTADPLLKLVAIAAKAAVIAIQLLQARDGRNDQSIRLAFNANEIATSQRSRNRAQSKRLRKPHPPDSLAWAAWIIAARRWTVPSPTARPHHPKHGLYYFPRGGRGATLVLRRDDDVVDVACNNRG